MLEVQAVTAEIKAAGRDVEVDFPIGNDGVLDQETVVGRACRPNDMDARAPFVFSVQAFIVVVIVIGENTAHLGADTREVFPELGGGTR